MKFSKEWIIIILISIFNVGSLTCQIDIDSLRKKLSIQYKIEYFYTIFAIPPNPKAPATKAMIKKINA